MLVFAVVAAGILAGAGVVIRRQIQYGRARLPLDVPAQSPRRRATFPIGVA